MHMRRVNVTLVVKAGSQREAEQATVARMNDWFCDPSQATPGDNGYPVGSLLHFTVQPESGHRQVAA